MLNRCLIKILLITNNQRFLFWSFSYISVLALFSMFLLSLIMCFFAQDVNLFALCTIPMSTQDQSYHINFLKFSKSLNLAFEILILLNLLLFLANHSLTPKFCQSYNNCYLLLSIDKNNAWFLLHNDIVTFCTHVLYYFEINIFRNCFMIV